MKTIDRIVGVIFLGVFTALLGMWIAMGNSMN
jgi:hypothetical protein